MGAQLSRIGTGRSALVVVVCAALALIGLVRSGLAGESAGNADSRDPVVLAPPRVKDPDLGSVEQVSRKPAAKQVGSADQLKTCVTALGQKIRVSRSFKCPKTQQLSTPNAKELRRSGKVVPAPQTGGSQAPAAPQQGSGQGTTKKPTNETTVRQGPASGGTPSKEPKTGGVQAEGDG